MLPSQDAGDVAYHVLNRRFTENLALLHSARRAVAERQPFERKYIPEGTTHHGSIREEGQVSSPLFLLEGEVLTLLNGKEERRSVMNPKVEEQRTEIRVG
jgi:hypothetical protein